jgi:hypothetical protein
MTKHLIYSSDDRYRANSFFASIPLFGYNRKVLRSLRAQLSSRSEFDDSAWVLLRDKAGFFYENRLAIFMLLKKNIDWPNYFFLPDDQAAVTLGFMPGTGGSGIDALRDICDFSGILNVSASFELVHGASLGSFFVAMESLRNHHDSQCDTRWAFFG